MDSGKFSDRTFHSCIIFLWTDAIVDIDVDNDVFRRFPAKWWSEMSETTSNCGISSSENDGVSSKSDVMVWLERVEWKCVCECFVMQKTEVFAELKFKESVKLNN